MTFKINKHRTALRFDPSATKATEGQMHVIQW